MSVIAALRDKSDLDEKLPALRRPQKNDKLDDVRKIPLNCPLSYEEIKELIEDDQKQPEYVEIYRNCLDYFDDHIYYVSEYANSIRKVKLDKYEV